MIWKVCNVLLSVFLRGPLIVVSRCCQGAVYLTKNHPHANPNSSTGGTERRVEEGFVRRLIVHKCCSSAMDTCSMAWECGWCLYFESAKPGDAWRVCSAEKLNNSYS